MEDKLKQATEGQELAWATDVTQAINNLNETCQNLTRICEILKGKVEHLEKRVKNAESRHRNLLQSLEDDELPRP